MPQLSGKTRPFAVLGHPISHSLSPVMHNAAFRSLGMDAIYLPFDVHPDRLMTVLPAMREMGFAGVNLTVPLKEVAFRGIADLDESARTLGAVNTVEFPGGGMRGHNTDGAGFLAAFREAFNTTPSGKSVFILGSGGAGRAVAIACADAGARKILVTDVDSPRAASLAKEISAKHGTESSAVRAGPETWRDAAAACDVVIQATPCGMKQSDAPLMDRNAFGKGQLLFDLVYMYPRTGIMIEAEAAGAACANGLGMLLHQGARAFTIWTGRPAAVEAMRAALEQAVYGDKP
ncbi:MAG: shikimate dehydrogenase [Lentisphaerae bacterium]|nr:shikimate dehydrogenase [Lentisphaerota bacterium]